MYENLQSSLTLKYGIKCVSGLSQRQELINQLISLSSIILEGWKIHVESVSDRKPRYEYLLNQYENERLGLIQPFSVYHNIINVIWFVIRVPHENSLISVDLEEFESAATLAEKYLDFTILVQLCDKTNDDERLAYYMDKYEKKVGFFFFFFFFFVKSNHWEIIEFVIIITL